MKPGFSDASPIVSSVGSASGVCVSSGLASGFGTIPVATPTDPPRRITPATAAAMMLAVLPEVRERVGAAVP